MDVALTLLDRYENHEHRPEYSSLVVRGTPWTTELPPHLAHLNLALLDEDAYAGWPQGDLGGTGNGWVLASTIEPTHIVLEAHDTPPPPDDRWADATESPFLTGGQGVVLTQLIEEPPMQGVRLGRPGLYRVRIHRDCFDDHWNWLLQFWPTGDALDPPRRLSRGPRSVHDNDLDSALATELLLTALWSPGQATKADLAERLLVSTQEIDAALQYASRHDLLPVDDDASTVSLVPVDKRPPEERDPAAARERSAAIKAWANENGVTVNRRGRIPAEVQEAFRRHR